MRLSLAQKYLILLLPLSIIGGIVVHLTWRSLSGGQTALYRANKSQELALASRVFVSNMGSSMKGYLLDPSNQSEYEEKKKADEQNVKALEELAALSDDADILALAKELEELDETKLNVAENKVMDLVKQGLLPEARTAFKEEYLPTRDNYDVLSQKLASLVAQHSHEEIKNVEAEQTHAAWTITMALVAGLGFIAIWLIFQTWRLRGTLSSIVNLVNGNATILSEQSNKISSGSTQMSSNVNKQSSALQETAASVEEINAMVKRTSENAVQSQAAANRCTQKASEGQQALMEMMNSIIRIRENSHSIQNKVEAGNKQIGEIVKVMTEIENKTKVINDIVFQTKLLSFNASVEAARAGENGKGFAVVAQEIGNLARMSGTSAAEISQLLQESATKVRNIIETNQSEIGGEIEKGIKATGQGEKTAEVCAQVFEELVTEVRGMDRALDEIAGAAKEQANGIQEITKAIGEIEQASRESSDTSVEFAETSKDVSDQSQELVGIVRDLSLVVMGKAEVSGFKKAA